MVSLQTADYVVIVILLLIPLGIGVFFAVRDAKRATRDEYLLGGRHMSMAPVMLSIFVTFQSAITLIGLPSETYAYGPMVFGQDVGIAISFLIAFFTVTPLLYPLRITSIFEYLQMRFESRTVRLVSTALGMLQVFFYLVIVLLAPGLALEAAAGIPLWMSVVIVGVTGTIYSALGGMKSVVWTDAFQSLVVFVGVFAIIIKSITDIGGVKKTWAIAESGGRTHLDKFNPDPRIRHNWYGGVLAGIVTWMSNMFSQSTCQRISAMKSYKSAQMATLLNIPLNLVYGVVCTGMGICMYSYLSHVGCDPLEAGLVNNGNQITAYFALHLMEDMPGVAGIFMSSLFSGSLSSMSSGINALAANTVEDLLQKPLKSVTEKTATTITKLVVFVYGIAIVCFVYLIRNFKGQVVQMAMSVFGCFGSSVLGMFLLGCTIPWGNKYGAVIGAGSSFAVNVWLVLGNAFYGRELVPLPPASTDVCLNSSSLVDDRNTTHVITNYVVVNSSISNTSHGFEYTTWESINSVPDTFSVYDISYEWHCVIGLIVCYSVAVIVSRITRHKFSNTPEPKLIFPFLRKFWGLNVAEIDMLHETKDEYADIDTKPLETGQL